MIITRKKAFNEILASLEGKRTVYLFGCDSCAEQCRTGGARELEEMTKALGERGFEVLGSSLLDETCYLQLVRREFRLKDAIPRADAVLVLACGAGVSSVADAAKETQPVLPALDSLFLAEVEHQGHFAEGCSLCGECVLADTGGICPHTECPKGLLNGPCGGMNAGMCEVNLENECAWVRIYRRLKAQGRLHLMKKACPPKDFSVAVKPRKVVLPRHK